MRAIDFLGNWKTSIALNPEAGLFKGGSDPDDVFQGALDNGWLLSALSIVAASGGVDDGDIDPLIRNLFVVPATSSTGVYGIRMWKNAQWHTMFVDDLLPVFKPGLATADPREEAQRAAIEAGADPKTFGLSKSKIKGASADSSKGGRGKGSAASGSSTAMVALTKAQKKAAAIAARRTVAARAIARRSRGAAFAHCKDMDELWVAIVEKAFAKFYGSYAALEKGYVQHALTDLTGADSDVVYLAEAARGPKRLELWQRMQRWRRNGFLLGAGTVSKSATRRTLLDSGLVFGAVYVIYEAVQIDGQRLIKLRNPPGDHGEW